MRHPIAETAGDRSTAASATLGRNVAVLIELTRLPGQRMNAPTAPGRYKVSKQLGSNERPLYLFTPSNVLEATSWNRHPCQRKAVLRVLMYASMVLNFVVQTSSCRPSSWLGDLKLTIFVRLGPFFTTLCVKLVNLRRLDSRSRCKQRGTLWRAQRQPRPLMVRTNCR